MRTESKKLSGRTASHHKRGVSGKNSSSQKDDSMMVDTRRFTAAFEKQKLHQQELLNYYTKKELEECTFHPLTNKSPNASRRNLREFLNDQAEYEERRQFKANKV